MRRGRWSTSETDHVRNCELDGPDGRDFNRLYEICLIHARGYISNGGAARMGPTRFDAALIEKGFEWGPLEGRLAVTVQRKGRSWTMPHLTRSKKGTLLLYFPSILWTSEWETACYVCTWLLRKLFNTGDIGFILINI